MDAKSMTSYLMVDYLRLELTGYVPPAPPGVAAFAGNNRTMVCWAAVPGATSYNILRSPGAGDIPIATGITGPVSGERPQRRHLHGHHCSQWERISLLSPIGKPCRTKRLFTAKPRSDPIARPLRKRAVRARRADCHRLRASSGRIKLESLARSELLQCLAYHAP